MDDTMKIAFVWTGVTSYMADCWRALAALPGVSLKVVIEEKTDPGTAFRVDEVMQGLDYSVVGSEEKYVEKVLPEEWRPDVLFIVGWHAKTCRWFATEPRWEKVPKVCVFDMPWQWRLRKIAARFVLWRYLRRFRAAYVPGRVAARYARWLGFKDVRTGLFGIRTEKFAGERKGGEPFFLYVGRNSSEKRLDDLRAAYAMYARQVERPWPLRLVGKGLEGGFAQPHEMPALYAQAGALVLASDFDPWPLVIAESCAAGLPVICTDRCTNHFELICDNGIVVKVGDVAGFAAAMRRLHQMADEARRRMGEGGRERVAPYDCRAWAARTLQMCEELKGRV